MLANRLYLGDVAFRDIIATDAHPAIIELELFEECQRILDARAEVHSQRAASNSDYHLTGLITCPRCGNKYVGTSAHGKLRRYRYYTCFSRTRYGAAGCSGARIDADLLDQAIQEALIDFYSRTDIIDAAITAELAHRAEGGHQREEELKAVTGQITTTQAAIDRYLTAFENGALDERACGHRVRDLTVKLDQLGTRRDDLIEQTAFPMAAPNARTIQRLRDGLAAVFAHGTPGQRKAIIETHVAEIKIDGNRLIPIFRIPTGNDTGPAETSADPGVRTTHRVVDPTWQYPNRVCAAQGRLS